MAARDRKELNARHVRRARQLAELHPASREGLLFYAEIAALQSRAAGAPPLEIRGALVELVRAKGTTVLKLTAESLDEGSCQQAIEAYLSGEDRSSTRSFFARVLLQASPRESPGEARSHEKKPFTHCPECGHLPQAAGLRPAGDGTALVLCCSLCLFEWSYPGQRCPGCGEVSESKLSYFRTDELPNLRVSACETCRCYLHAVDLGADREAIVVVDELTALPLDLWVREKGFRKIQPNLLGI